MVPVPCDRARWAAYSHSAPADTMEMRHMAAVTEPGVTAVALDTRAVRMMPGAMAPAMKMLAAHRMVAAAQWTAVQTTTETVLHSARSMTEMGLDWLPKWPLRVRDESENVPCLPGG